MKSFDKFHQKARKRRLRWQPIFVFLFGIAFSMLSRIAIKGKENLPDGSYILAPNHISLLDALIIGIAIRRKVSFMGKSELFETKWGKWMSRLGGFPVQRGIWDKEAFETAERVIAKGNVMVMFLEGGINNDPKTMKPAKPGIGFLAQKTGAPVVPCWLSGNRKLYNPLSWPKISITFGTPLVFEEKSLQKEESTRIAWEIRESILALKERA